jgi:hypothetical protein
MCLLSTTVATNEGEVNGNQKESGRSERRRMDECGSQDQEGFCSVRESLGIGRRKGIVDCKNVQLNIRGVRWDRMTAERQRQSH